MLDASPLLSVFPFVGVINKVFIQQKKKKNTHVLKKSMQLKKNSNVISIIALYFAIVLEMQQYISSCYTKTSELTSIKHKPIVDK